VWYDNDDDDNDSETSATTTATGTVVTCEYHDVLENEYYCPRLSKRQRRCITLVPDNLTNRSLFVPILEDPETATTTHQQEGGFPPPSLPFAIRQEEEKDEQREGAGRSISFSNYLLEETTPILQRKKKKKISRLQDIEQEEQQPYDIEQEEQQGSRCCYLDPFVYNISTSNSNPSPLLRMILSTRSNSSSKYLKSYPYYDSQEGTVQRQRHTPRRVVPTPPPFLPFSSSSFPVVGCALIDDTIVEQFQRATRLNEEHEHDQEQEELSPPPPPPTTTIKRPPSFDICSAINFNKG